VSKRGGRPRPESKPSRGRFLRQLSLKSPERFRLQQAGTLRTLTLADGFWSGAGGPILRAIVGVGVTAAGGIARSLLTRRRESRDLDGAKRTVADMFRSFASYMRGVSGAGESLSHLPTDDSSLQDARDLLRMRADRALWSRIANGFEAIGRL